MGGLCFEEPCVTPVDRAEIRGLPTAVLAHPEENDNLSGSRLRHNDEPFARIQLAMNK
jgi:hypothetical protein